MNELYKYFIVDRVELKVIHALLYSGRGPKNMDVPKNCLKILLCYLDM